MSTTLYSDDGGHDVFDKFEFSCNSMKNLISIWNFTNTVMKNVKHDVNFKSVEVGHHSSNRYEDMQDTFEELITV